MAFCKDSSVTRITESNIFTDTQVKHDAILENETQLAVKSLLVKITDRMPIK